MARKQRQRKSGGNNFLCRSKLSPPILTVRSVRTSCCEKEICSSPYEEGYSQKRTNPVVICLEELQDSDIECLICISRTRIFIKPARVGLRMTFRSVSSTFSQIQSKGQYSFISENYDVVADPTSSVKLLIRTGSPTSDSCT